MSQKTLCLCIILHTLAATSGSLLVSRSVRPFLDHSVGMWLFLISTTDFKLNLFRAVFFPALPVLQHEFDTSVETINLTMAAYFLTMAFGVSAPTSDWLIGN